MEEIRCNRLGLLPDGNKDKLVDVGKLQASVQFKLIVVTRLSVYVRERKCSEFTLHQLWPPNSMHERPFFGNGNIFLISRSYIEWIQRLETVSGLCPLGT